MIDEPWIASVFRVARIAGDTPGIAAMHELSGVAFDSLQIVYSAQSWRTEQAIKETKGGAR